MKRPFRQSKRILLKDSKFRYKWPPINGMTVFERKQYRLGKIQTVLILLALVSATCIGLKQNQINERLISLDLYPHIAIIYGDGKLIIYNNGSHVLWLWGTKFDGESANFVDKPCLIPTRGNYHLYTDRLEKIIKNEKSGEDRFSKSLDLYIESADQKKYVIENQLFFKKYNDTSFLIDTQTKGIYQGNW